MRVIDSHSHFFSRPFFDALASGRSADRASGSSECLEKSVGSISEATQAAASMSLASHMIDLGKWDRARELCEAAAEVAGETPGVDVSVYLSAARRLAGHDPALGVRIGLIVEGDPDEDLDQASMHIARAAACRDCGHLKATSESLVAASALASGFEDPGLITWFRKEHHKAV